MTSKTPSELPPIEDELRNQFELVTMRRMADALKTTGHWGERTAIDRQARDSRKVEEQLYTETYDERIDEARRRLIDEAAGRPRDFKPAWAGEDRFSRDAIEHEAHRQVQAAHDKRMQEIDREEQSKLDALIRKAARETSPGNSPRQTFAQASTRSPAMERRGGWVRRRDS